MEGEYDLRFIYELSEVTLDYFPGTPSKLLQNVHSCIAPFAGTMLFYKPGLLAGGVLEHICNPQRSIGYYLEAVILLGPFCKKPIRLNLKGVTNDKFDPTVCTVRKPKCF